MLKKVQNFLTNEEGASAVEYGLIVGLIAVVIVGVLITSGQNLLVLFTNLSDALTNAVSG